MNSRPLSVEDAQRLRSSAASLRQQLSELEQLESLNLDEWFDSINELFGDFYKNLYDVVMSSRKSHNVPPLDSISHTDFINDVIELESATNKIRSVLSSTTVLNNERARFPNGDVGEVCFTLARVLWHLTDFQFPTKGRFLEDIKSIHLSINGEGVEIEKS